MHVTTSHDSVPKAHDKSHDQYPSQGNFNNNNNVEVTPKMILPFLKWIMYKTRLSLSLLYSLLLILSAQVMMGVKTPGTLSN